jgi:ornithine cyclodeaminase
MLVLSARDVHRLLAYDECADAMRIALGALARGEANQPMRTVLRPEGARGLMALMPSYLQGDAAVYGLKAICITAGNPAIGLDAHQGIVLLSSAQTGEPLAVLNASAITEIRTAAVSAVATALLARPDADVLAIIGTGVQARAHLLAIPGSRALAQIRVAGRDHARALRFAESMQDQAAAPVVACASAREAVDGAGIIVTATSSAQPVLERGWLTPGAHINAVGACVPAARELDNATIADAALFADSRESVSTESGDYLRALADGAIQPDHVRAELGEILIGAAPGRSGDQEITVFESLGLAVEDLAAAALTYRKAVAAGVGCQAEF